MIVCSCSLISDKEIERAVDELLAEDPYIVLTPLAVYHATGKRPRCGGCLPLITRLMHDKAQKARGT